MSKKKRIYRKVITNFNGMIMVAAGLMAFIMSYCVWSGMLLVDFTKHNSWINFLFSFLAMICAVILFTLFLEAIIRKKEHEYVEVKDKNLVIR